MENSYDRLLCWFTFSEYLLDPKGPNISQKYDEIKKIIADLYKIGHKVDNDKVKVKEHKDRACEYYKGGPCEGYELFITGHRYVSQKGRPSASVRCCKFLTCSYYLSLLAIWRFAVLVAL